MKKLTICFITVLGVCLSASGQSREPYRLRVGDLLNVGFRREVRFMAHGEKEAETYVLVEKDGKISPKLVEPIKVAGLTIVEVRKALMKAYSNKLKIEYLSAWVIVYPPCGRKN